MKNKILLAVIFFVAIAFIPITNANATQVYVGVQISSATAPGFPSGTNNNWCLPTSLGDINNPTSQMVVTTNGACPDTDDNLNYPADWVCSDCPGYCLTASAPSTNPKKTTSPTCAGGIIWSGLLNLTNNSPYKIYLYTPNTCSGYVSDWGRCLEIAGANQNCNDVCAHYGQTPSSYCYYQGNSSNNCSEIAALKGSPCSTCTNMPTYSWYDANGNCNYYNYYQDCSVAAPDITRVCDCNFTNLSDRGFLFPFTASF